MFTGFATENSPNIQVWDFANASASSLYGASIGLADDCAPIQYFKTGQNTTTINVYLPTSPVEGKTITIINNRFAANSQTVYVFTSDNSGTTPIYYTYPGGSETFIYSKYFVGYGPTSGYLRSGWVSLKGSPVTSANYYAAVLSGLQNTANSAYSVVAGGASNYASSSYAAVLGGGTNSASSSYSAVAGGNANTAGSTGAFVGGGGSNTANGSYSSISGGYTNTANSAGSTVVGGYYGTTRAIGGMTVFPGSNGPIISSTGVTQAGLLLLGVVTIDATSTVLRSNSSAASTTNQLILPNNSAYYFRGSTIGTVTGGGATKAWSFEGAIKRGAVAATTSIIQAVVNPVAEDATSASWTFALAVDSVNGGLQVLVGGAAATTIRWTCKIETTEVTY